MQTLKIEVQDNLLDKILWLLNSFNGVKVKQIDEQQIFLEEVQNSEKDILVNNIVEIDNIDDYINNLKNEVI